MVTRDRDGVGDSATPVVARVFMAWRTHSGLVFLYDNLFTVGMMVMLTAVDGVQDSVGRARKTVAEGMEMAVLVVVSHVTLVLGQVNSLSGLGGPDVSLEWTCALTGLPLLKVSFDGVIPDVDLSVDVAAVWFSVAVRQHISKGTQRNATAFGRWRMV